MTTISLQDLSLQLGVGVQSSLRAIDNPMDGILPDFSFFGAEFTELWQKLLAGFWGLAILVVVIFLIYGISKMATASTSHNPQEYKSAKSQSIGTGIALGALAIVPVLVGAVLNVAG